MVRSPASVLAGCVVGAGLILVEFGSISDQRPSSGARFPPAEIESAAPEIRNRADILSSPEQRPPETSSSANEADSLLRDVRLTGVVTGPDLRIAIFAVTGANALVLSEGETLKDWRLDSISRERVVLSGPAGKIVLKPKPDPNLVRSPPPAAVQSGPLEPGVSSGPALAGPPRQPMAVAPIVVANLSAVAPGETQRYPYSPEHYAGYNQYYPYDYYPVPWDAGYPWGWSWGAQWGWGWPVAFGGCFNCRFRPAFFHPRLLHSAGLAHSGFPLSYAQLISQE
jgi:hypothetical protein